MSRLSRLRLLTTTSSVCDGAHIGTVSGASHLHVARTRRKWSAGLGVSRDVTADWATLAPLEHKAA